jgi:hypothetical protein
MYGAFRTRENIWMAGSLVILAIMCLFVAVFFLIDRRLQSKKGLVHTDTLFASIESSLAQVNHQIWLLENVFWWYLFPFGAGAFLFGIVTTWNVFKVLQWGRVLLVFGAGMLLMTLIFWGVYWINQYAVRKGLVPRKQELESLLDSLANGSKTI